MVLLGHNFFNEINQLLPVPHISVWSLKLHAGYLVIVAVWHSTNHNHESCIWQIWEVTSRIWPTCSRQSVAGRLLSRLPLFFASQISPPEPCLHNSLKSSQTTVAESVRQYQNFPMSARSRMCPKNLQPQSASAGADPTTVSTCSVPALSADAFSRETPPPILSSTCWMH